MRFLKEMQFRNAFWTEIGPVWDPKGGQMKPKRDPTWSQNGTQNRPTKEDQILELYPQDFIPSRKAEDYLIRTSAFVDELLERFYGMEPFYNAESAELSSEISTK